MLSPTSPTQKTLSEEDSSGSDAGSEVGPEPETDRFGFIVTNGSTAGSVGPAPELVRQRETKWISIISQWDRMLLKKTSKVKVQSQKGIPASLRAKCWPLLCGATDRMKLNENVYQSLDSQPALQSWVDVIKRDLDRQFPFHEMFLSKDGHGQQGLFRVLKAYTKYQPEEGYCQAQGPVAAVLLMNMPAEEAFWCLVQISEQYLPGYYSPLLEGVLFDAAMLTWVLKRTCPAAHKHLQHHGVEPLMFATDWLMCLFTRHLPFNTLLRVWDLFFCHGVRVLLQVAVVLVRRVLGRAEQRKQCPGQMETLERLRGVREEVQEEDDAFIAEVCSVQLSARDLDKHTEKELEKWRKDRPSSTFDPRGRCHGYRMAWERARQNEAERDRREREKGNLSVPLTRSASALSLSPSFLQKRWRKGGKASTREWEGGGGGGGGKVVRHFSMGAKEDWRSWSELNFKKVQGVQEEEDTVFEEHKKQSEPELKTQTEQKELKKTEIQNVPTGNVEEARIVKKTEKEKSKSLTEPTEEAKVKTTPTKNEFFENVLQPAELKQRDIQDSDTEVKDTKEKQVETGITGEEKSQFKETEESKMLPEQTEETNAEREQSKDQNILQPAEHKPGEEHLEMEVKDTKEKDTEEKSQLKETEESKMLPEQTEINAETEQTTVQNIHEHKQGEEHLEIVGKDRKDRETVAEENDTNIVEENLTEIPDADAEKNTEQDSQPQTQTEVKDTEEKEAEKQVEIGIIGEEKLQEEIEMLTEQVEETKNPAEGEIVENIVEEHVEIVVKDRKETEEQVAESKHANTEEENQTETQRDADADKTTELDSYSQSQVQEQQNPKSEHFDIEVEEEKEKQVETGITGEEKCKMLSEQTEETHAEIEQTEGQIVENTLEEQLEVVVKDTEKKDKVAESKHTDTEEENQTEKYNIEVKEPEEKEMETQEETQVTEEEKSPFKEAEEMHSGQEETNAETEQREENEDRETEEREAENNADADKSTEVEMQESEEGLIQKPAERAETENVQQVELTEMNSGSETKSDPNEGKYRSAESLSESDVTEKSHTQTEMETDELAQSQEQVEDNVATQDEAEKAETLCSPECIEPKETSEALEEECDAAERRQEEEERCLVDSDQTQAEEKPTGAEIAVILTEHDGSPVETSEEPAPEPPRSQATVGAVKQEETAPGNRAGQDEVFVSTESTTSDPKDSHQAEAESSGSARRSSRTSVDLCVRKSPSSRGSRLARRLSEDLFTTPEKPKKSDHADVEHGEKESDPAAEKQEKPSDKTPSNPPKRFGLFRRLRGEQPKKPPKIQVPKILIQDFSDGTGTGKVVEEEVDEEEKLSSRERRRRRRERERREKEEERSRKKREKELEKERRKPQTRGKSFQKGSDVTQPAKTEAPTRRYSASVTESYF